MKNFIITIALVLLFVMFNNFQMGVVFAEEVRSGDWIDARERVYYTAYMCY